MCYSNETMARAASADSSEETGSTKESSPTPHAHLAHHGYAHSQHSLNTHRNTDTQYATLKPQHSHHNTHTTTLTLKHSHHNTHATLASQHTLKHSLQHLHHNTLTRTNTTLPSFIIHVTLYPSNGFRTLH